MAKSQSLKDLEIDPVAHGSPRGAPPQYIDLDKLENVDGVVAIISMRLSTRAITFALFKEFERDRRTERTSFFAASLRESYESMVDLVFKRIDELSHDAEAMARAQREALEQMSDPSAREHAARVLKIRLGARS